jgi:hypothetical protein
MDAIAATALTRTGTGAIDGYPLRGASRTLPRSASAS